MSKRNDLTKPYVASRLKYDGATGAFVWLPLMGSSRRENAWNAHYAGSTAGSENRDGHVVIRIDNRPYFAHRLAWLLTHGEWPIDQIDHKDCNRKNNRIENLRLATSRQNKANRVPTAKSGIKGAYIRNGRFHVAINACGDRRYLGSFACATAASIAFTREHRRLYGEYSRTSL